MECTTQSRAVYQFVRPERQDDFGGLPAYEWPAPKWDRDSITVDRLRPDIDGAAHRFTIIRGDVVEIFCSSSKVELGEVLGISHAKQEVCIQFAADTDGVWIDVAQIYPTPLDEEEAFLESKLSDVIEEVNYQHEPDEGFTEAGRLFEPEPAFAPRYSLDDYKEFRKRFAEQSITIEQLIEAFQQMYQAEDGFIEDLKARFNAKQIQNVARNMGQFGGKTKQENAESIYNTLLRSFYLQGMLSYSPPQSMKDRLLELVPTQTSDDLKQYFDSQENRRKADEKIEKNPESLDEYRELIRLKGIGHLTDEQLAIYDQLAAEQSRKSREAAKPIVVSKFESASLSESSFRIKQGFHEKKGCPLWIVQLTERVERNVYNELNQKAKMLGGWFSSFKKADAGFQFTSEESATKFSALLNGNADRTSELENRKEFKEQTAAERLAEVANRLLENAEAVLQADDSKLKNTTRRANMAAGMRGRAYADIAMAKTIQSLAVSMERGETKFLDGVRTRTQIETLQSIWRQAKHVHVLKMIKEAANSDKELSYAERDSEWQRLPNLADVPFAKLPYPSVHKRLLLELITASAGKSGCVQISKKMAKHIKTAAKEDLVGFKSVHDIELLQEFVSRVKAVGNDVKWVEQSLEDWKRLQAANIHTIEELRSALRELSQHQSVKQSDDPITKAEDNLRGRQLPGFFPTPRTIIDRMLELVQLKGTERVLEPSCGKGDILDAITEQFPEILVTAIEQNRTLQEILEAKGYEVDFQDFLDHQGQYDCIVMNPPFENGQDIDWRAPIFCTRCYESTGWLKPTAGRRQFSASEAHAEEAENCRANSVGV